MLTLKQHSFLTEIYPENDPYSPRILYLNNARILCRYQLVILYYIFYWDPVAREDIKVGEATEDLNPDQHSCVNIYFSLDCQKQREIYVKILLFLYQ